MTLKEFIAEIETDLSVYADSGSLDHNTIKRIVLNEMKVFGNNILPLNETVLQIKNSQATLPEGFRSLKCALKIEPFGCNLDGCDRDELDRSILYRTFVEDPAWYNEVTQEYVETCNSKVIREYLHFGNSTASFYYHRPQWLSLVKGVNSNLLATDCYNISKRLRQKCEHQINISNSILNASFKDGQIYIQYYGFEVDQDGEIIIPEGYHNNLQKYLEFYVKYRIALQLAGNNSNSQGLTQLIPIYKQESEAAKALTLTESKFTALNKTDWKTPIKVANRVSFLKYELPRL